MSVTQLSEFWTVHEQPAGPDTVRVTVPPLFATSISVGVTVNEHAAAFWFTVSVRPAIVSTPERGVGFGFGATTYCSQAVPAPVLPFGIVIQGTLLEADQSHVEDVEMNALLVEPLALAETVAGETE